MKYVVPEQIETERLLLRGFQNDDWEDLHAYFSDAESVKYTVGRVFTEGETWRAMCSMIGHWQIHGYGPYALEEKSSGRVLGTVGFWYPNDWPSPEIMWALTPQSRGKGFASKAARQVQKTARGSLPDISLISLVHPDNIAFQKLALAIGATLESRHEFRGSMVHIYRHP